MRNTPLSNLNREQRPLIDEHQRLASVVRDAVRAALLRGDPAAQIEVSPVTRHTNINYVFEVRFADRMLFAKAALDRLKMFDFQVPKLRVLREASWAQEFASWVFPHALVPAVLFKDSERFVIGLEDVGEGRQPLIDVVANNHGNWVPLASALGAALGRLARLTRTAGKVPEARLPIGRQAWRAIMSLGVETLIPAALGTLLIPMCEREQSAIHSDLWGKNILVGNGVRPAILDFENAGIGDPAIDLSSLLTVFAIPCLLGQAPPELFAAFAYRLHFAYVEQAGGVWAEQALARSYWCTCLNLAHRSVGAAPYALSTAQRQLVSRAAVRIYERRPSSIMGLNSALFDTNGFA